VEPVVKYLLVGWVGDEREDHRTGDLDAHWRRDEAEGACKLDGVGRLRPQTGDALNIENR